MKKTVYFFFVICSALVLVSFISKNNSKHVNSDNKFFIEPDSLFVKEAASSSMMEVTLGNMAQQKAASERVRAFGAMMVRDHTMATQDLMTVASSRGFRMPDSMMRKHSMHVTHLTGLTGAAFDVAYMTMMVEAHKDDIDEFEDASKKAKDTAVRGFAGRQLPILIMHRDSARAIRGAIR